MGVLIPLTNSYFSSNLADYEGSRGSLFAGEERCPFVLVIDVSLNKWAFRSSQRSVSLPNIQTLLGTGDKVGSVLMLWVDVLFVLFKKPSKRFPQEESSQEVNKVGSIRRFGCYVFV